MAAVRNLSFRNDCGMAAECAMRLICLSNPKWLTAKLAVVLLSASMIAQTTRVPTGFTPIFDGKDLKGWHVSRSNHHGHEPNFHVDNGMLIANEHPYGQGGILLTDKKYHNFELSLEVNPDSECDGGIFLRSTETGSGYQVDLTARGDNPPALPLLGEDMPLSRGKDMAPRQVSTGIWKMHDWNSLRIRMVGDAPRVTVWLNETMLYDIQQPRNDLLGDETDGMIALQLHWNAFPTAAGFIGQMWAPGAAHRFRNIAIKELP